MALAMTQDFVPCLMEPSETSVYFGCSCHMYFWEGLREMLLKHVAFTI